MSKLGANIFFYINYIFPTTYGPQKFAKIRVFKVDYRISANSCRDNYSFLEALVRQLFKGDNYSKEETINLLALLSH